MADESSPELDRSWRPISIVPSGLLVEIAVINAAGVHPVAIPCRRELNGWLNAETDEYLREANPTHWRPWRGDAQPYSICADYPIPNNLQDAFAQAIIAFQEWKPGGDEPRVHWEQADFSIGTICDFVAPFGDVAPKYICNAIFDLWIAFGPKSEHLNFLSSDPQTCSYRTAALHLLQLYEARRALYQRKPLLEP